MSEVRDCSLMPGWNLILITIPLLLIQHVTFSLILVVSCALRPLEAPDITSLFMEGGGGNRRNP